MGNRIRLARAWAPEQNPDHAALGLGQLLGLVPGGQAIIIVIAPLDARPDRRLELGLADAVGNPHLVRGKPGLGNPQAACLGPRHEQVVFDRPVERFLGGQVSAGNRLLQIVGDRVEQVPGMAIRVRPNCVPEAHPLAVDRSRIAAKLQVQPIAQQETDTVKRRQHIGVFADHVRR